MRKIQKCFFFSHFSVYSENEIIYYVYFVLFYALFFGPERIFRNLFFGWLLFAHLRFFSGFVSVFRHS